MRKPSPPMIVALLSLFVALSGVAVAANGGSFVLGQSNTATANTSLSAPVAGGKALQLTNNDTSNAASTALGLTVASGHAPFTVNTGIKVTSLNADKIDGIDSTGFLPKTGTAANAAKLGGQLAGYYLAATGKAADSDKLDGIDSNGFARAGALTWIAPTLGCNVIICWKNFASGWSEAAYVKDPFGIVHLKGILQCIGDIADCTGSSDQPIAIFTLPAEDRPAANAIFAVLSGDQLGRITVRANGEVDAEIGKYVEPGWISLDGITFPAA